MRQAQSAYEDEQRRLQSGLVWMMAFLRILS